MRIFWLWAALGLAVGFALPMLGLCVLGLGALVFGCLRRRPNRPVLAVAGALLAGLSAAGAETAWQAGLPSADALPMPLSGVVETVDLAGDGVRVVVSPDGAPSYRLRVKIATRPAGLAPGAHVLVTGELKRPDPADNPGTLDYRAWCGTRRIAFMVHGGLELLAPAGGFAEGVVQARERARAAILDTGHPDGSALLMGLLLGDQSLMPPWTVRAFEDTGTGHLLSVSGVHISGVALIALWLGTRFGRRLGLVRPEVPGALLALPASTLFVTLSQFPVAGVRSGLMVALSLLGRLFARKADGRNILGLAALVVLATSPGLVREPSFQLSFGTVLALVTFGGGGGAGSGDGGLPALLWASLVAGLATLPIQCACFGTVALFAPLANLVVVPLASAVVVPAGLLALLLHPILPGAMNVAAILAELLGAVTEVLGQAGGGLWVPGTWASVALATPIVVLCALRWAGGRAAVVSGLGVLLGGLAFQPPDTTIDFLAVGQGDAILLRSHGRAVLIDTGPDETAATLRATLRALGVSHLDAVAISHAHPDHFGGLIGLAQWVPIAALYTNGRLGTGRDGAQMARALAGAHLHPRPPPGRLRLGALLLETFNATPPPEARENNASIVVRVRGPGGEVLLPGDIEQETEAVLAPLLAAQGQVDVVKAPHHGSRTSSTPAFLEAVEPRAVVFTVGRQNRFRFPRPEVEARYAGRGVAQWETDTDGAVRVVFEDEGLRMQAFHRRGESFLARRPVSTTALAAH